MLNKQHLFFNGIILKQYNLETLASWSQQNKADASSLSSLFSFLHLLNPKSHGIFLPIIPACLISSLSGEGWSLPLAWQ